MNTSDDNSPLTGYREALNILAIQPSEPTKPLTIPASLRRSYDENFLSDYLAYILNPKHNGIGIHPLAALCRSYGRNPDDLFLDKVIIYREYGLDSGRIDLLLEIEGQWVLGIENKIFSPEGEGQTISYAKHINSKFQNVDRDFLFLTIGGERAQEDVFRSVSYNRLLVALKTVTLADDIEIRKRILWEDFLQHLEEYIVMSTSGQFAFSEKAKLYLEHYRMLQDMEHIFNSDWNEAVDYLKDRCIAFKKDDLWQTDTFKGESKGQLSWIVIQKKTWKKDASINVQFWWSLSPWEWIDKKIPFKIDVYGSLADAFLTLMNERYPTVQEQYTQKEVDYRPANRRYCIAQKNYNFDESIEGAVGVLIQTFAFRSPTHDNENHPHRNHLAGRTAQHHVGTHPHRRRADRAGRDFLRAQGHQRDGTRRFRQPSAGAQRL
jgi:hypothetical protein